MTGRARGDRVAAPRAATTAALTAAIAALALALALQTPVSAAAARTTAPRAAQPRATATDPNALVQPMDLYRAPRGRRLSGEQALLIAGRLADVRGQLHGNRGAYGVPYEKGVAFWQVSYYSHGKEIAQVLIADANGRVLEHWTGFKVAWSMARGYPGAFGKHLNALYVWLPLTLIFVAGLWDPRRRPWSPRNLDLLALSSFSISLAFFNHGEIDQSVPLAYPPLIYLLARMLVIGLRRREPSREPLRMLLPAGWVALAVVFLVGFRVGLNLSDGNVIDVGYAGVIGAHKLAEGQRVYGNFPHDNASGDTYGPVVYEAYVPFERLFGWSGHWDDLPAAHAAAVFFDLLCVGLLALIGRRIRGPTLGNALAFAWAAYPFTFYALESDTNDSLVAATILLALLFATSAPARGAFSALAGLTKFAPLALVPLMASQDWDDTVPWSRRLRATALFVVALLATAAVVFLPVLLHGSLRVFYDHTITYQANRGSPFSVWGLYGGIDWLQTLVQVAAVVLALALALLPRRRDVAGLAALSAAIVIALQLGVTHWFYLYIPWFFAPAIVALLGREAQPAT